MNPRRQYTKVASFLISSNAVLALISFVTSAFLARELGIENFGNLSYALALGGYAFALVWWGFERTLVRDLIQNPDDVSELITGSVIVRGIVFLPVLFVVLACSKLVQSDFESELLLFLIVFGSALPSLGLMPVFDALYASKNFTNIYILERLVYFGAIWGLYFSGWQLTIEYVAVSHLIASLLSLIAQYFWVMKRSPLVATRIAIFRGLEMAKGNVWVLGAVLSQLSQGTFSRIYIQVNSGPTDLGGFSAAWLVVAAASVVFTQVGRLGEPYVAAIKITSESGSKFFKFYLSGLIALGVVIAVPPVVLGHEMLKFLGAGYSDSTNTLTVLSLYVVVIAIGYFPSQYLVAHKLEKQYAISLAVAGLVNILLLYVFVPMHGALGAAFAILVSHFLAVLYWLVLTVYDYKKTFDHLN